MSAESQYTTIVATSRQLCGSLALRCDSTPNLDGIGRKSRGIISTSLQGLLTELREQGGKLITAIRTSRNSMSYLQELHGCLEDINRFLDELDNLTFVFANKTKFKRKCLDLSHALSAKRTTLFNSVTMALLGQPSARVGGSKSMLNANISNTTRSKVDSPHESQERERHAPRATAHEDSALDDAPGGSRGANSGDGEDISGRAQLVSMGGLQLFSVGHTYYYGISCGRNFTLAFNAFEQAAGAGDIDGMHMLSKCYQRGHGCEKNDVKACRWLLRAVENGNASASVDLATVIFKTAWRDYTQQQLPFADQQEMDNRAEQSLVEKWMSDVPSSSQVGRLPTDLQKFIHYCQGAVDLLLQAARDGHIEAQSEIGYLNECISSRQELTDLARHIRGLSGDTEISPDSNIALIVNALNWYISAAEDGSCVSARRAGLLLLEGSEGNFLADEQRAIEYIHQASKGGDSLAHYIAGRCAERAISANNGTNHVATKSKPDVELALALYRTGTSVGQVDCMCSYGHLLVRYAVERLGNLAPGLSRAEVQEKEVVTPQDLKVYDQHVREGIYWLRTASNAGSAQAAYQLGRAYQQGVGVPKDLYAANQMYQWAYESAKVSQQLSDPRDISAAAAFACGNTFYAGFGTYAPTIEQMHAACEFYMIAAKENHAEAQNAYALLLEDGRATSQVVKTFHEQHNDSDKEIAQRLGRRCVPLPVAAAQYYHASAMQGHVPAMINLARILASGSIPSSFISINGSKVTTLQCVRWLRENCTTIFDSSSTNADMIGLTLQEANVYFNHLVQHLCNMSFAVAPDEGADVAWELKQLIQKHTLVQKAKRSQKNTESKEQERNKPEKSLEDPALKFLQERLARMMATTASSPAHIAAATGLDSVTSGDAESKQDATTESNPSVYEEFTTESTASMLSESSQATPAAVAGVDLKVEQSSSSSSSSSEDEGEVNKTGTRSPTQRFMSRPVSSPKSVHKTSRRGDFVMQPPSPLTMPRGPISVGTNSSAPSPTAAAALAPSPKEVGNKTTSERPLRPSRPPVPASSLTVAASPVAQLESGTANAADDDEFDIDISEGAKPSLNITTASSSTSTSSSSSERSVQELSRGLRKSPERKLNTQQSRALEDSLEFPSGQSLVGVSVMDDAGVSSGGDKYGKYSMSNSYTSSESDKVAGSEAALAPPDDPVDSENEFDFDGSLNASSTFPTIRALNNKEKSRETGSEAASG